MFKGIAASEGIVIGKAYVYKTEKLNTNKVSIEDTENEKERLKRAVEQGTNEINIIKEQTKNKLGKDKAGIFEAHIMMIEDPEFIDAINDKIDKEHVNAEYAVNEVMYYFFTIFNGMDNEYMKQRGADVKDVGNRLIRILNGIKENNLSNLNDECIIAAEDITPSDTATMDTEKVLGFASDAGGRTSHSAIMARSLEIPAVVGLKTITENVKDGDTLILDGNEGCVIVNPDEETLKKYTVKAESERKLKEELNVLKNMQGVTKDGKKVEIAGNIGTPKDLKGVLDKGADGVGLFRTEFLYMNRDSMPEEEEQFESYKEVAEKMEGRPVIIRTLDIGGDKKLSYLKMPDEMNPFLGYRAIRLCLDRKDIFRVQLRALLRASVYGNIKIMFPMISGVEELREAKSELKKAMTELDTEGIKYNKDVKVGIMIEIPSAAIVSDILAEEADFFSIGTNDLMQYTMAVDRGNEKVAYIYSPFNPGVLRLIKLTIDNAHKKGIYAGMCGEMAGDTRIAPLLVGFGIDELSMSASSILRVKKAVNSITYEDAKKAADEVAKCKSCSEIEETLKKWFK